jgi:outer membrane protein
MKKNRCKWLIVVSLSVLACAAAAAQQITRFGVVDTSKVYQAYFRNSAPVRNYESKKTEYQQEINNLTQELQQLQQQKVEYEKDNKQAAAMRVESEITKKTDFLNEYTNAKNVELESLKKSLQSSDQFYKKLYDTLAKIAESGGYSMILSLQQSNSILWYSPSVDITDQVITELGL